jgi:hypothetical protein
MPKFAGGARRPIRMLSILTAPSVEAMHHNIRDGLEDCGISGHIIATARNMARGVYTGYPTPTA